MTQLNLDRNLDHHLEAEAESCLIISFPKKCHFRAAFAFFAEHLNSCPLPITPLPILAYFSLFKLIVPYFSLF